MKQRNRGVLSLGAVALLLALALITPAGATQGEPVVAGEGNEATAVTSITNTTAAAGERGLEAFGFTAGVYGQGATGVYGTGTTYGVEGGGPIGVRGSGGSGTGVEGFVEGESQSNRAGIGVRGTGLNHLTGVVGIGGREGVWGQAGGEPGGVGVRASGARTYGVALETEGVTTFSRSGKFVIPSGESKVTKFLTSSAHFNDQISAKTLVLATLQQNRPGVFIQSAVPKSGDTNGSITVFLNKAVNVNTTVAWFLLN